MSYFRFFTTHPRILCFGILLTLFSNFGQTFLISIFVPRILSDLSMGTGEFGTLYAAATVSSALCLPFFGRLLDRTNLQSYSLLVGAGLMLACFAMSVAGNALILFMAILGLRLTGQGLLGLTASTTMARSFTLTRGKALSISALGYPLGEGLLPMIIVLLMNLVGWRWSWGILGGIIFMVLLPLITQLAHEVPDAQDKMTPGVIPHLNLWRDTRFWFLMPGALVLPFILTGLFLYQVPLAAYKGWSAQTMATAFIGFAISRLGLSLLIGPWVDRLGALRLFPFYLMPLVAGMALLYIVQASWGAFAFLILAGISQGCGSPGMTALWTEVYGSAALGSVKSIVAMVGVLSTALSPVLIGWLLQGGITFDVLVPGCIALGVLGIAFSLLANRRLGQAC